MKKLDNKGLSLIEIMVALAIGGIVLGALMMVLSQSLAGYRKQLVLSQIQNDVNIALNQMSDKIMEADRITIKNVGDGKTEYIKLKDDMYYIYDSDAQILYQSKSLSDAQKSLLCENVADFKIRLEKSCLDIDDTLNRVTGIRDNVQLSVCIQVERQQESRTVERVIKVRNPIEDVFFVSEGTSKSVKEYLLSELAECLSDTH